MDQVFIDTERLWDIGRLAEQVGYQSANIAQSFRVKCRALRYVGDPLVSYEELLIREISNIENQSERCSRIAGYILKMAEGYEETEKKHDRLMADALSAIGGVSQSGNADNEDRSFTIHGKFYV